MSYAKWALLRTAGGLAGNYAYYQARLKQLDTAQGKLPNQAHLRLLSQSEIESLLPGARKEIAERIYGPSDSTWETKVRTGLIHALDELKHLQRMKSWSDANCFRFLEIFTFLNHIHNIEDVMNDILRLDMKLGDNLGLAKMSECFQVINDTACGPLGSKIQDCGQRMETWCDEMASSPDMTYVLAEALFRIQGVPERCRRSYGELYL